MRHIFLTFLVVCCLVFTAHVNSYGADEPKSKNISQVVAELKAAYAVDVKQMSEIANEDAPPGTAAEDPLSQPLVFPHRPSVV